MECCNAKLRFDGRSNPRPAPGEDSVKETTEETSNRLMDEAGGSRVWDPHTKTITAANRKVTSVEGNSHVILPRPLVNADEAELHIRKQRYTEAVNQYILEDTKSGYPKSNLTNQEKLGLQKLLKRIKNKELIVAATDKTSKLCAITSDMYQTIGSKHTNKDIPITACEVSKLQKESSGHTSMWI